MDKPKLITLDFETYYDRQFSLSKMTTEAYIRDPQFEVIGVGYRIEDGDVHWVTGDRVEQALHALDLPNNHLLCHNTAFDGAILAWRYGIKPKFMFDTMSMARPVTGLTVGASLEKLAQKFCLGEKGKEVVAALGKRLKDFTPEELAQYGEYCKNDVVLTYNLFHVLQQFSTPHEMYMIDMLLRMYTDPVLVLNGVTLERHLNEVRERKASLMSMIDSTIGRDELMSNPKFAELLRNYGVEPPMKISAATGKETFAFGKTDIAFKNLQEHEDLRVQLLVSARLGVKSTLEETRTESFLGISKRGPLPIMLNYYGAHTGRASGGDKVNLQNLPRGGALRYSMRAPDGHVLVACDSSQIEARMLAWFAGQEDLVAQFANGDDVYSLFASKVYGFEVTKANKVERHVGKTCILGLGYGTGKDKLRDSLKTGFIPVTVSTEESEKYVYTYRTGYSMIPKLWKECDNAIKAMASGTSYEIGIPIKLLCDHEGVHLPNGMIVRYPNLSYRYADGDKIKKDGYYYDTRYGPNSLYGAKMVENVIQALARIVVFTQMAKIDQKLRKYDLVKPNVRFKTVLTVHDEVVSIAPEPAEDKVKNMMIEVMSTAPKWAIGLPLACEADAGYSYGDCK